MKVAVVTGAAKGLGADVVRYLAGEAYTVVIHYHSSKDPAQDLLKEIKLKSPNSFIISADLKKEDDVEKMFAEVIKKLKRVDLLVNNVGNFVFKPFKATQNSEFKDLLESSIYSTLFCSRAALPAMRKQRFGHIINIGAVGADRVVIRENSMPYFLGKNGVYVLTKTLAWEEAENGIHVNMISPASMETDIFAAEDFPMKRAATHDDVIKALAFLTSEDAYYINGANLEVAGGFVPGMAKAE